MKMFVHLIFVILYGLVAFFGIGPILMADGTMSERLLTLVIVIIIFFMLILLHNFFVRKMDRK